ncbi:hypothetical protein ACLB2K_054881 [Fragaria x ananassa]
MRRPEGIDEDRVLNCRVQENVDVVPLLVITQRTCWRPPRPAPPARGGLRRRGGGVVVEGKPGDDWRRRLERHDEANWHKPSTWQEMERLLESYDGCTDYDVGDVPKVVVDTTAGVAVQERVYSVVEFIKIHCGF